MWLDIVAKGETTHRNISTFPYKQTGLIENHTLKIWRKFDFSPQSVQILICSPNVSYHLD